MLFDNNPRRMQCSHLKCKYPEADVYRFILILRKRCEMISAINYNCKYLPYAKMTNLQNYALTCTTEPVEFFISAVANVGATTKLSSGGVFVPLYYTI
ncbi:hypothetical protein T12_12352 [Trichinella patagoniensis]|uniref:Uncharacterized protein n=1 Tax=Trichinella patagoniensis TaxID=990121 RepID=A0A0V0ZZ87_9BILA|nr:hypothetical protein T12_12352 [Trichinella patagoniensis]